MTKFNPLEREIMEARIDELRRQAHVLERQLLLSNQNGSTHEMSAHDTSHATEATQICVGVG